MEELLNTNKITIKGVKNMSGKLEGISFCITGSLENFKPRSKAEELVIKLGGTITAEHGDGLARSEFIKMQYGAKNYQVFREIKKFFDPKNVLNPGKIITKKSTIIENLENL